MYDDATLHNWKNKNIWNNKDHKFRKNVFKFVEWGDGHHSTGLVKRWDFPMTSALFKQKKNNNFEVFAEQHF